MEQPVKWPRMNNPDEQDMMAMPKHRLLLAHSVTCRLGSAVLERREDDDDQ
jgi:hypothetical protein